MAVDRNIAVLVFRINGQRREWRIGACRETSTEETLRAHLARWSPGAEWVGFRWEERGETNDGPSK